MQTTQIIQTGDQYEIADASNSEIPAWPVQGADARWHYEEFPGQVAHYNRQHVAFGFMAAEIPASSIPLDEDGDLDFNGLDDVYVCGDKFFKSI